MSAQFDVGDPAQIGWSYPPDDVVSFVYQGHPFPQGVQRLAAPIFTHFLDGLCALPGFRLHSGSGLDDGDWGAEDRNIVGGSGKSFHAYAIAIDINAPWNPQGVQDPPAGPFRLPDATDQLALSLGLLWGGNSRFGRPDRMHVELHLSPAEVAGHQVPVHVPPPFPLSAGWCFGMPGRGSQIVSGQMAGGPYSRSIQAIQRAVDAVPDGIFGPHTDAAVRIEQTLCGVVVDGLVGPITWRACFP